MESSLSSAAWGALLSVFVLGCSGATAPVSSPSPSPSATAEASPAAPVASSAAPPASSAAAPAPPPADPCALPPPRVLVPTSAKGNSLLAFDVGPDGRLYWVTQDVLSKEGEIFSLALGEADAKPQRVRGFKIPTSVSAMVVGREGYWLGVDNMNQPICGSRVLWLGRDAEKTAPASEIGCLSGPVRAPGAEALWGVRKSYTSPMTPVVAKGAPPGGIAQMPRGFDGDVEVIATTAEGVYFAFDNGEVKMRTPGGEMKDLFLPLSPRETQFARALAVHGEHIYLLSGPSRGGLELFRLPRKGGHGTRDKIASFDVKDSSSVLQATDGAVLLSLTQRGKPGQLLLLDPAGSCPQVELSPPERAGSVVVDRGVVYTLHREGILASPLGARGAARPAAP